VTVPVPLDPWAYRAFDRAMSLSPDDRDRLLAFAARWGALDDALAVMSEWDEKVQASSTCRWCGLTIVLEHGPGDERRRWCHLSGGRTPFYAMARTCRSANASRGRYDGVPAKSAEPMADRAEASS